MIKNIRDYDGEFEADAYINLFEKEIEIHFESEEDIAYAELCVAHFNTLSEEQITQICEAAIRYCNEFLEEIDEEPQIFATPRDVLKEITPRGMQIAQPVNRSVPIIDLELDCSWEEEHGMQWVIRGDKVLYVGAYEGVDPEGDCGAGEDGNYIV